MAIDCLLFTAAYTPGKSLLIPFTWLEVTSYQGLFPNAPGGHAAHILQFDGFNWSMELAAEFFSKAKQHFLVN